MYWNVSYNARPTVTTYSCLSVLFGGGTVLRFGRGGGDAAPAVTLPPGELMYMDIGFSGLSASKKSN